MEAVMPWIVYETTNLKNGKKYVGVHKQDGEGFDGYLGSGKSISAAIAKYGRGNFERRTLCSFDSEEEAYAREGEIVTPEWCKRKDNYNMKPGGFGGFPFHDKKFVESHAARAREQITRKNSDPEFKKRQAAAARAVMRAMNSDPEFRRQSADRMRALNALQKSDPEFRKRQADASRKFLESMNSDPEFQAKRLARVRASNSDQEFQAKRLAGIMARNSDPEFQAKRLAAFRAMHADPEFAAKHSARVKAMHADPEFKKKHSAAVKAGHLLRRIAKATAMLVVIQDAHVSQDAVA